MISKHYNVMLSTCGKAVAVLLLVNMTNAAQNFKTEKEYDDAMEQMFRQKKEVSRLERLERERLRQCKKNDDDKERAEAKRSYWRCPEPAAFNCCPNPDEVLWCTCGAKKPNTEVTYEETNKYWYSWNNESTKEDSEKEEKSEAASEPQELPRKEDAPAPVNGKKRKYEGTIEIAAEGQWNCTYCTKWVDESETKCYFCDMKKGVREDKFKKFGRPMKFGKVRQKCTKEIDSEFKLDNLQAFESPDEKELQLLTADYTLAFEGTSVCKIIEWDSFKNVGQIEIVNNPENIKRFIKLTKGNRIFQSRINFSYNAEDGNYTFYLL